MDFFFHIVTFIFCQAIFQPNLRVKIAWQKNKKATIGKKKVR
jgi:hypothetical protein